MEDETTIKVHKQDLLVLKQIQNLLELQNRSITQSDFLHEVLGFLLGYQDEFLKEMVNEMENQRLRHERLLQEWMRVVMKKTQEL